jgi:MFS family permease
VSRRVDGLRSPRYFSLWLGQIVSNLGDTLNYVAVVVLVFRLRHCGLAVSALVVAEIVPTLLLGPVAGVVIDRFDRQCVLSAADLVCGTLIVALVFTQVV